VTDEHEGADRKPDDPFEDLDAFFAPIGDLDAEEPTPPPIRPPGQGAGGAGAERAEETSAQDEILPSGWTAGLDDVEPQPSERRESEPPGPVEEPISRAGEPVAGEAESGAVYLGEPTSEFQGKEWDRFRDALDSMNDKGEPGPGYDEGEAAPPVGRHLSPDAPEPVGVDAGDFADQDAEPDWAEASEEGPAGGREPEGLDLVEGEEEEAAPTLEEREAAADHFAGSIRETPDRVEEDLLADLDRSEVTPPHVRVGADGPPEAPDEVPSEEEPGGHRLRVGAVDPLSGGPSWQEPTGEDIGLEPEGGAPVGRNIPAAFLSALILVGLGLGSLAIGPGPFAVVAGIIVVLAQGELYGAMVNARYQPATAIGLVFGGFVLAAAYLKGEAAMLSMLALCVVFSFLWFMATPARARRNTLANVALTIMGVAYVPLFAGFALIIVSLPGTGRALLISIIGLAFLHDIAAFFGGYIWGNRQLAPTISPKKSWEGLVVATVVVVGVGLAVLPQVDAIGTVARAAGLAVTIALFAPLGDLAESLLKRDLGIKDMGTLLPGHGGALDRIDSVLFAAPAAFYYIRLFF
jgi:phosphatidate cytidylyltransferase